MINISKLIKAQSVSGYNMCLFGNPKLTVFCGNCSGMFKTRDYIIIKNKNKEISVFCPYCCYYNLTGLFNGEA